MIVFLTKNEILHENQFGFRAKLSTCAALLQLVNKITGSIDRKETTIGVFIDLAKAFDTVDHKILLQKLERYSIRRVSLNYFRNYLSSRQQFVTINGISLSRTYNKCGVPQGSILEPLLFLL